MEEGRTQQPKVEPRAFSAAMEPSNEVVKGMVSISSKNAYTLFDSGSTHSFISPKFSKEICLPSHKLESGIAVKTAGGSTIPASEAFEDCPIKISDKILAAKLISLPIVDFDIILGMDWLSTHYAHIDCKNKEVRLSPPNQPVVTYSCQGKREDHPIISSIEAKKFLKEGGKGYLAMIHEEPKDELRLEEVPIV
ncbi:retroviral-like aspartic protease family protein [Aciditerrimonas ferrireducens]|uniref:Retroviral-like aspartic protease family protein n=1 Tax=Aciditerrimonas ferrireducens TaxID=667306 RepID=A0ABV6C6A9_9ACTN